MKSAALILAGSGSCDGSEIHEATLALYFLSLEGFKTQVFAPNVVQYDVVNHLNGENNNENRNVLVESARIARGNILPIEDLYSADFDVLVIPGGFGAAKNLFTFAYDGINFSVNEHVEKAILSFHSARKPIAAMCIAPVMISNVLGKYGVEVTLGPQSELGYDLSKKYGANIVVAQPSEVVVDEHNKVVTTPAYMYGDSTIKEVGEGAHNLVRSLKSLM